MRRVVDKIKPEVLPIPQRVELSEIESSPFQPRTTLPKIDELAAEIIADGGIRQPAWLRPIECDQSLSKTQIAAKKSKGIFYQLVAGHRRAAAAEKAGYSWIPAVVRKLNDLEARRIALTDNTNGEPLSDYDEAQAVIQLWSAYEEAEDQQISQNEMCRRLSRSAQYMINKKKMDAISDDLRPIAQAHSGVMTQLFEIDETRGELRAELINLFDTEGHKRASVNDVRNAINNYQSSHRSSSQNYTAPDPETQSRQSAAAQNGSAPMSRGHRITSTSKREASQNAAQVVGYAGANLESARQWIEQGGAAPRAALMELRRKIDALLDL